MSLHQCIYCKSMVKSAKALDNHLVFQHEAWVEGDIKEESIRSLLKIMDQVKLVLIKCPETRSNDKILYLKILQYFFKNVIYDSNDKLIKPASGKAGFSYIEWLLFPSYETVRRSRQALQNKAKENIKGGIGTRLDAEMLASEKVAEQRDLKRQAYETYFVRN